MGTTSLARADRRLWIALASAALWHGGLLIAGSYRRTYDAYIHMFFGDHYARDWFSTWEPRWYTGFTVTSYPPGTHQLIALLSKLLPLEAAFVCVQVTAVLLLVVGVYRFSLIWVDARAAGWAALLATVSTSIAEVVHVFGQLPTSFSLAMLLNTLPSVFAWVRNGSRGDLIVATAGLAATTAAHHVTTLFGMVFFVAPVIATALIDGLRTPRSSENGGSHGRLNRTTIKGAVVRRLRRVLPSTIRAGVIGVIAVFALVTVVLPYWLWSSSDPIVQVPIPHASRDNFLENIPAGLVFVVVPWGLLGALAPLALLRSAASRALPLVASTSLLALLGTGGTTPLPRMILRGAFDILTLDRFTIWATIAVLPLAGSLVESATGGRISRVARAQLGQRVWSAALAVGAGAFVVAAVLAANFSQFRPLQPDRIAPEPIAEFMDKDQHDRWRYLTLGFGDQMARVAAETTAQTVDGNYHSARRLPELTSRSVERLEGAKFRGIPGIGSLQQFLAVPERYHLKFVFSNDVFYDPLLWASGWHRLDRLQNGIQVWEREDIPPLPDVLPERELPGWQRLMWGSLPMTALASATLALGWAFVGQPTGRRVRWLARQLGSIPRNSRPAQLWRAFDARLERIVAATPAGTPRQSWHRDLIAAGRSRVDRLASVAGPSRALRAGLCGALLLLLVPGLAVARTGATESSPADVVTAWYDDLDFQRFDSAWQRLDPQRRTSFEQFQLERSVSDGLVSGYGKLDSIETEVTGRTGDTATVRATTTWLTSLTAHEIVTDHDLRRSDGQWWIVPEPSDVSTTPDQFSRAADVQWLSQGRRQVTTEQTLFGDVLDRPRIETLSVATVALDGQISVVGELTNLDVDPADLTITARLLDAFGEELVAHNASLVSIHKALPRETVPFRIDLEAIAGSTDVDDEAAGDFHPELFSAPQIDVDAIDRVELITRAVVTGRDLSRDLQLEGLAIAQEGDSWKLTGRLRNNGVVTATVPHVLVTLLDADGNVGWVDHLWVTEAVRPQRSIDIELALTDAEAVELLISDVMIFGNGITTGEGAPFVSDATIPVPEGLGWSGARVAVSAFERVPS